MSYFLGIDGGGTKTKVVVIDDQDQIIYEGSSGPSSIDTVTNEETLNSFKTALNPFYIKYQNITFESIFCGLGGIVDEDDYHHVESLLKNLNGVNDSTYIRARNDMENALYSGLCFDEGMTLICGTGMVAYGKDTFENTHKAGGWGYKEGDLGSGYDLGMRALRHVIKAYDGRQSQDEFSKDIADQIGLKKANDFVDIMDQYYLNRTWIASLSPLVTKHANLGNVYAKEMIDLATDELALSVRAVFNNLRLKEKVLVIVGSLGNSGGYFVNQLHKKITEIDPYINIIKPIVDPALAAAKMAKYLIKTL